MSLAFPLKRCPKAVPSVFITDACATPWRRSKIVLQRRISRRARLLAFPATVISTGGLLAAGPPRESLKTVVLDVSRDLIRCSPSALAGPLSRFRDLVQPRSPLALSVASSRHRRALTTRPRGVASVDR
jgi:hypothetical protein